MFTLSAPQFSFTYPMPTFADRLLHFLTTFPAPPPLPDEVRALNRLLTLGATPASGPAGADGLSAVNLEAKQLGKGQLLHLGSDTTNVEPTPGWLCTVIVPPALVIIFLIM